MGVVLSNRNVPYLILKSKQGKTGVKVVQKNRLQSADDVAVFKRGGELEKFLCVSFG